MHKEDPFHPKIIKMVEEKSLLPDILKETLKQPHKGYRFSEDALLLANSIRPAPGENILEIGSGCGIIPLCIARQHPSVKFTTIEIQEGLAECAQFNIALCKHEGQIKVIRGDARRLWQTLPKHSFQRVISNPPYRKAGEGKLNPEPEKAVARHEITLSMKEIVAWSRELLVSGGKINFIYPSSRYEEAAGWLKANGFDLTEMEEIRRERNPVRIYHARLI